MELHALTAAGKFRRKYSPEHALFAAGNALRVSKYYQSMGLAEEEEEEEEDGDDVFVCRLFQCRGVGFRSLRAYEDHYDLLHRNVCRECLRSFLSARLLDLHVSETHDAYFRVLAKRQPMYACLADGCARVFTHDDKRTRHLVADHLYPPSFRFHNARRPRVRREESRKPAPRSRVAPSQDTGPTEKPDADAIKISKAHARKLKRREKKKQEAREKKSLVNSDVAMDVGDATVGEDTPHVAMQGDQGDLGGLTERMTQLRLMVPKSISFGRRQQRR